MGIASRTKWEERIARKPVNRRHIDSQKFAHRFAVDNEFQLDRMQGRMIADNLWRKRVEACDKATAIRKRIASNRKYRGWLPFAKR